MPVILDNGASSSSPDALKMKKALERGHNRPLVEGSWLPRPTEYSVYLFTVARRSFGLTHALLGDLEIPACKPDERYRLVRFIPHPFPQKVEDVFGVGAEPFHYHSAERIAQDICDPSNPTLNQNIENYTTIDPYWIGQPGTRLSRQGVFWSRNPVPTEDELAAAEKRRDNYYRLLIKRIDELFMRDPRQAAIELSEDHHVALDFFGEERPFHKKYTPMSACPNCAQQISQGVAYHRDPDGDLCVIDWKRTCESGKRKLEDVPPSKRWWSDDPPLSTKKSSS